MLSEASGLVTESTHPYSRGRDPSTAFVAARHHSAQDDKQRIRLRHSSSRLTVTPSPENGCDATAGNSRILSSDFNCGTSVVCISFHR